VPFGLKLRDDHYWHDDIMFRKAQEGAGIGQQDGGVDHKCVDGGFPSRDSKTGRSIFRCTGF
jgi:hypothetical protein